jgi:hypothetical protein
MSDPTLHLCRLREALTRAGTCGLCVRASAWRELAGIDRGADGAAGLGFVAAVAEPPISHRER